MRRVHDGKTGPVARPSHFGRAPLRTAGHLRENGRSCKRRAGNGGGKGGRRRGGGEATGQIEARREACPSPDTFPSGFVASASRCGRRPTRPIWMALRWFAPCRSPPAPPLPTKPLPVRLWRGGDGGAGGGGGAPAPNGHGLLSAAFFRGGGGGLVVFAAPAWCHRVGR